MTDEASLSTIAFSQASGSLTIGCNNKELGLVISISGFYSKQENIKMMYRIDQNPPVNTTASPAISGQAFWPTDAKTMIDGLLAGKKLTVRVFRHNDRSYDGNFDLPEGHQYISQVKKYCGQAQ
jgi:hypothetical protein